MSDQNTMIKSNAQAKGVKGNKIRSWKIRSSNIICGVVYRQHNSPQQFLDYFDETLEKFSALNKPIFIMGYFNINLLAVETCSYAHKFHPSLQSYSLIPKVDKPTLDSKIKSGNIVSDISDHYS